MTQPCCQPCGLILFYFSSHLISLRVINGHELVSRTCLHRIGPKDIHIVASSVQNSSAISCQHGGDYWLAELAHDRKVLGLIPATSKLFSLEPAYLKMVWCQLI